MGKPEVAAGFRGSGRQRIEQGTVDRPAFDQGGRGGERRGVARQPYNRSRQRLGKWSDRAVGEVQTDRVATSSGTGRNASTVAV